MRFYNAPLFLIKDGECFKSLVVSDKKRLPAIVIFLRFARCCVRTK